VPNRRRLIVMRHAKAEPFAETDRQRALTDRGRQNAFAAGEHLAAAGAVPDYAVVSSAARAVATWDAVAAGSGSSAKVALDDAVYSGSPDVVLEALRAVPEDAEVVIFVGHNPAAAYVAHLLDDGHGDAEAVHGMLQGYPTSAMTILEIDVPWADLAPESGRVVDFYAGA
jgi:phosphohistidine phosphatase